MKETKYCSFRIYYTDSYHK